MAGGDWIKLHRKMLDSPIMRHDGMFRLWAYCLLYANWRPAKWLLPGTLREIQVGRGQFVTGRLSLHRTLYPPRDQDGRLVSREWTPCPRTLWRWLDALRVMGCVNLETLSSRCTLVTVCNYTLYQEGSDAPCPAGVPLVSRWCPADVPLTSTTEESKKARREEYKDNTITADFDRFWDAYPRKEAKPAAKKAFARLATTPELLDAILAAVARQQRCGCLEPRVAADGRSVIPHPATWLNNRRWEDAPPPRHETNGHGTDLFAGVRAFVARTAALESSQEDLSNDP